MKHFKTLITVILLFQLVLMSSCRLIVRAVANNNYSKKKGGIPADFGNNPGVILFSNIQTKHVQKAFRKVVPKKYHGEFEFVNSSDINTARYADVNKYRYVFIYDRKMYTSYTDVNKISYSNSFYVFDRKEQKAYNSGFSSGFYKTIMKVYVRNLERERVRK